MIFKIMILKIFLTLDITRLCRNGIFCSGNSQHNWFMAKSLNLGVTKNSDLYTGGFFMDICLNENRKKFSCDTKSCDGVYRSYTGCCNNIYTNTEHGQIYINSYYSTNYYITLYNYIFITLYKITLRVRFH